MLNQKMDHTLMEPTSQPSEQEDVHLANCQSQSRHALATARSNRSLTGLIVSRGIAPHLGSLERISIGHIDQPSHFTLSCLVEQIRNRNISSGSEDRPNDGERPRQSLLSTLHRHLPMSQIRYGIPYVIERSSLPQISWAAAGTAISPSQLTSPLPSNGFGNQTTAEMNRRIHQYEESILYMLRVLDCILDGSRLSLISQANNNGANFRLVTDQINQPPNQSLVVYVTETRDRYRDMRLDVDNMSYEDLLALEDSIGYVCTGLPDGTVAHFLKHSKYFLLAKENSQKESCTICQEDYVEEDDLGALDCGHGFHTICIKKWLRYKNQCPVCKSTALCCAMDSTPLQIQNM